jgi:hypothetical protein
VEPVPSRTSPPALQRGGCRRRVSLFTKTQVPLHPDDYETPYVPQRIPPPPIQLSPHPAHLVAFPRPKSSPSTFGPNVEDLLFPENPFRIKQDLDYASPMFNMSPLPSSKAPSPYYGGEYPVSNPSISPGRPAPIPIAPDPVGLRQMNALKRMREEEDYAEFTQKRRKRAPSQPGPVELNEEEQLLLKLKEEENLPWKDIATRFQTELGKSYQVPALQMRFKRLRERMRTWTETDVGRSLRLRGRTRAHSDSEAGASTRTSLRLLGKIPVRYHRRQGTWSTGGGGLGGCVVLIPIPQMLDFGASERWPAKYCARKWEEIHPGRTPFQQQTSLLQDPWDPGHYSPRESLDHSPRPDGRPTT